MHTHGVLAKCGRCSTKSTQCAVICTCIASAFCNQFCMLYDWCDLYFLMQTASWALYVYCTLLHCIYLYIYSVYIYISVSAWASPLRSPKSLKSSNTLAPPPELCSPCLSSHWRISVWVWQGNLLTFGARRCWDSPADTGLGDWGTGLWLLESCKKMWRTPSCRGL